MRRPCQDSATANTEKDGQQGEQSSTSSHNLSSSPIPALSNDACRQRHPSSTAVYVPTIARPRSRKDTRLSVKKTEAIPQPGK